MHTSEQPCSAMKAGTDEYAGVHCRTLPYGRQCIDRDDIDAVIKVLMSDYITTGPAVAEFEKGIACRVGAGHAVAVSSGTAALHSAMHAIGIGPGDEVIVPAVTFAATANCVVYQGGTPVFADIDPDTLLIDPQQVKKNITSRTKAVIGVDYAGQPCDWDALRDIAGHHDLCLVADGCHALGAAYKGKAVGCLADLTVFSFHPVKHITTGEGGMVTTDNPLYAEKMRRFRNHGISADHHQRAGEKTWFYEMLDLGFNYRITDFQCALGLSQLAKLDRFISHRQAIATDYTARLEPVSGISPLQVLPEVVHAYHLYVIRIDEKRFGCDREQVFGCLRQHGIGANVHYIPVYLHPYYRTAFATGPGLCPQAEQACREILSLPVHPGLTGSDTGRVVDLLQASGGKR